MFYKNQIRQQHSKIGNTRKQYTLNEIIVGTFPYSRFQISRRNSQENTYKRKIDRQLAGQSSSTPFMNIRDGYNSKKLVTFDIQDKLDDHLVKITSMMNKLTAQGNNQNRSFKPKFTKAKEEDKQEIKALSPWGQGHTIPPHV